MKSDAVRNGFGEGRVVGARQAVALGMADRVGTLEETVDQLLNRNIPAGATSSKSLQPDMEHEAQRLRDYVQIFK